jgi:hypothetical protein
MKTALPLVFSALIVVGCAPRTQVDFAWFNLSGHEIFVTDVSGLPPYASPGMLVAMPDDTSGAHGATATSWESIDVGDSIKITWSESGTSQRFEAKRADLSVPARLQGGQLKFTYQGHGKWRVRFVDHNL